MSRLGRVGYPGRAAHCASKHAVNGLVRAPAVEWAPVGITVNAVAPTFVDTVLLASRPAALLTGPVLAVDGGWTAW